MLTIENLTKRYGKFAAVDHLSLHIDQGEIFGFVGPNGAGKTTTMRIVCGLLKATEGTVTVDGVRAEEHPMEVRRKIGYVPDFFGVYDNLKVSEYMEFYGSMYGLTRKETEDISEELLATVNLSDKKDAFVDTLSRGMQQRLCVARALLHDPKLLVLDEPNSGLDPRARYEMKEIMRRLSEMGKTILISSHILPELSQMCTSIGIMEHGRLMMSGKVDEIEASARGSLPLHLKVVYVENAGSGNGRDYLENLLLEQPFVDQVTFLEDEVRVNFGGDDYEASKLLKCLIEHKVMVSRFYREKENLESLFLEITGGEADA